MRHRCYGDHRISLKIARFSNLVPNVIRLTHWPPVSTAIAARKLQLPAGRAPPARPCQVRRLRSRTCCPGAPSERLVGASGMRDTLLAERCRDPASLPALPDSGVWVHGLPSRSEESRRDLFSFHGDRPGPLRRKDCCRRRKPKEALPW